MASENIIRFMTAPPAVMPDEALVLIREPIRASISKRYCTGCQSTFPVEECTGTNLCRSCLRRKRKYDRQQRMKRDLAKLPAAIEALTNPARDPIDAAKMVNGLLKRVGGAEKLGRMIGDHLEEVVADPLIPVKEKRLTLQGTATLVQAGDKLERERNASIENFSCEELRTTLYPLCVELMATDEEFRTAVCKRLGVTLVEGRNVVESESLPVEYAPHE